MDFLVRYKKLFIAVLSILLILYVTFLFVIPNVINLNAYKSDIQRIFMDSAKLNVDFNNIKIVTTPTLKAGVRAEGIKVNFPEGKNIVSLQTGEVKIALLPLIFKVLKVSDITLEKPEISLVYTKDGQIDLVDYVTKNLEQQQTTPDTAAAELPVKFSSALPVIKITNYKLLLSDEKTLNNIALQGDNFIFDKAVINKHFRVQSIGSLLVNENKNINYDVKFASFWPAFTSENEENNTAVVPQIDFINEIVKYNPKTDITADIDLKEHKGHIDVSGIVDAKGINIILNGNKLPDGYFYMKSSGHDTQIDSVLYVAKDEKASLNAKISHGHKNKVNLNLKTDKISFLSIQQFIIALLNSFNVENDIALFNLKGYMNADFSINTDMKNFESSGFFKVLDASVSHKKIPLQINNIGVDVNLANNNMNINNAKAVVNGTQVNALGKIDSKANTDITIKSGDINIAPLFNAFAPVDIKKSYSLNSGILSINIFLKGRLADIEPNINLVLNNLSLKDRLNTFAFINKSTLVNIKAKNTSFSGDVDVTGSSFKINNPKTNISMPLAKINITPDCINIAPFDVKMNSSKVNVSGDIKNYMKKMKIDIDLNGSVLANDLKNLLPNDFKSFVFVKGSIPLYGKISGDDKKKELVIQAHSDANNYFAPITVSKMISKSGLLNLSAVLSEDKLSLNDASLYLANKSNLSSDFAYNKKGAVKIVGLSGIVSEISSSHPTLKLSFVVPEQILLSSPVFKNASLKAKGEVSITGTIDNPSYKGFFTLKEINLLDFLTKIQDFDMEFNDNTVTAKIQNLDINGTSMNIDADVLTKFTNILLVKSMKVTCANFDVDNIFRAMDKFNVAMSSSAPSNSSSSVGNNLVMPVKISNGVLSIQQFKMKQVGGDFIASNITGNFNLLNDLFTLDDLKASVYNGSITGKVTYHLATTAVNALIKGNGVNANNIVTVFAALKDQVMGNVDFDANVKLKGSTYEQQIKSLNGKVHFELKDGQLGSLGRFETFLKADNLVSQGFIVTQIGSLINTVAPYNTGKFSYLNGNLNIINGVANFNPIKMSGPHMSLLITGNANILTMISSMQIMGSLSPEVMSALGPVANLSVEKFATYIPKFGTSIATALNNFNAAANKSDLAKIPALSPAKENTRSFKVVLNGNLNNPTSAIKRFQWLNTPEEIQQEQQSLLESVKTTVPTNKEELKQQLKEGLTNQLEKNEKVQEIKQNKAVKTLSDIYNFYKQKNTTTETTQESATP